MAIDEEAALKLINMSKAQLKKMVVEEIINQVLELEGESLRQLYVKVVGTDNFVNIKNNTEILRRRICYKIQKDRFGGMKKIHQNRINKLSQQTSENLTKASKLNKYKPLAGTKIVRVWRGDKYEITAAESGYEYQGQIYNSLTKLATEITGVKRSGPVFFGLKENANG
jgi:hypothetical protein